MPTTTKALTLNAALDLADPNKVADALRQYKLGTTETLIKATITGLTSGTTFDITAIAKALIAVNQGPDSVKNAGVLPAIKTLRTLRVTAGTTFVGSYALTDAAGTAVSPATSTIVGLATISDDGKTLVFPGAITAFIIEYFALPSTIATGGLFAAVNLGANFEQ